MSTMEPDERPVRRAGRRPPLGRGPEPQRLRWDEPEAADYAATEDPDASTDS